MLCAINHTCHTIPQYALTLWNLWNMMTRRDSTCARLSPGESAMVFHREGYGLPARPIHAGRCFLFQNPTTKILVQRKLRECDIQAWVPAWQSHLWWQSLSRCVCYRCCPPSARHRWLPLELAVKPLNSWNAWTNMLVNLPSVVKLAFPQSTHRNFSVMAH